MSPDVNYKLEISKIGGIVLLFPDNSDAILPDYCISRKELTVLFIILFVQFSNIIILNFGVIHVVVVVVVVVLTIVICHFKF